MFRSTNFNERFSDWIPYLPQLFVSESAETQPATPEHASLPPPAAAPSKPKKRQLKRLTPFQPLPHLRMQDKTAMNKYLLTEAKKARRIATDLKRKLDQKSRLLKDIGKIDDQKVLSYCRGRVEDNFLEILQCELQNFKRKPQGRRFKAKWKALFLDLHEKGPKGYRSEPGVRPGRKTIRRLKKSLNIEPGINPIIISSLASRAKTLPDEELDVSLILDEISLQEALEYDHIQDFIRGFMDNGFGDRGDMPAGYALVGMLRSIYGKWKQAIVFYFTNGTLTGADMAGMIVPLIEAVNSTGVRIVNLITDGNQKNLTAMWILGASPENPFFFVQGARVTVMIDVPHLMKSLRNALLLYVLQLPNGTVIDFEYIRRVIEKDMTLEVRAAPKITKAHLTPGTFSKQNVPLATQLYSKTVAGLVTTYSVLGYLPPEAMRTGKFISEVDDLFDSWMGTGPPRPDKNGVVKKYKSCLTDTSDHLKFWNEMENKMSRWHFIGSKNLTFHKNWVMNIRAVRILWMYFKSKGRTYLAVGHLNSDCIENFFSILRFNQGHFHNLTVVIFGSAFARGLINQLTIVVKGKNCRDDNAKTLMHLTALLEEAERREREVGKTVLPIPPHQVEEQPQTSTEELDIVQILGEVLEELGEEEVDDPDPAGLEPQPSTSTAAASRVPAKRKDLFSTERIRSCLSGLPAVNSAVVAAPLLRSYLLKANCDLCRELLAMDCSFPLHTGIMMTNDDPLGKHPGTAVTLAVQEVYHAAAAELPSFLHVKGVMARFMEIILRLPAVQDIKMCPLHEGEERILFIRSIAGKALSDAILKINQDITVWKNEKKKSLSEAESTSA